VDYCEVKEITHKDSYPLPRIDDTLEALSGAKYFSTLDLKSGYWQVKVDERDKEKTAFSTGKGLWQFTVMPFGLCNAPRTFEQLMERVLAGLSLSTALVYLDDIIIPRKSFRHQLQNLRQVLQRLQEAHLKLAPKKCTLFQKQVKYLGHVVSSKGISPDSEKVEAVHSWPRPTNIKELGGFLGLASYYRRFIPAFATLARPLHQYTEKGVPFIWTEDAEEAFQQLKRCLIIVNRSCILG